MGSRSVPFFVDPDGVQWYVWIIDDVVHVQCWVAQAWGVERMVGQGSTFVNALAERCRARYGRFIGIATMEVSMGNGCAWCEMILPHDTSVVGGHLGLAEFMEVITEHLASGLVMPVVVQPDPVWVPEVVEW